MPRRPYRLENFARAGRYRLVRAAREADRQGADDQQHEASASSASSDAGDEDMDVSDLSAGAASEAGTDSEREELDSDGGNGFQSENSNSDEDPVDAPLEGNFDSDSEDNGGELESDSDARSHSGEELDGGEIGEEQEVEAEDAQEEEDDSEDGEDLDDEEQEDGLILNGDHALYPNAPITVGESMYMTLMFALNHNLSGKCIADLLQLISLHCITPNNCVTSLYSFKRFFATADIPLQKHYYCKACQLPLEQEEHCHACNVDRGKSYFITIPLIPQISTLFKRNGFYEKLRHRFERVKENVDNREDIYDGEVYIEHSREGGFLNNPNAISFCWNSDGVPVYKSSKYSIWPFFLQINELPYDERIRNENVILGGLWFGPHKPHPNIFLVPLLEDLTQLFRGVQIQIPQHPHPITVKGALLYGTCDMPAKALFLNFKSYNGYYGCTVCKQRGERSPENIHVLYYRFTNDFVLRNDEETEHFADLADQHGEPVFGVKGHSILSRMTLSSPVISTAIDPMHKYSGLTMKLLEMWFDSKFSDHPASISPLLQLVDRRLCNIKPPNHVERLPRSLKHLKYFKVSELKLILMTYGLCILNDLQSDLYKNHFKLLVGGLYLLNKPSVSEDDINLASIFLMDFVSQFGILYGREYITCNVHQLLHLSVMTRRLGPLFVGSCAPFENMNGILKKYVHGTRYADLQICTAASLYMKQLFFKERHLRDDGPVQAFCDRLACRQKRLKLVVINDRVSVVGRLRRCERLPVIVRDTLRNCGVAIHNVYLCNKVFFKKRVYVAETYTRAKKTASYCVKFRHAGMNNCIGNIQYFVRATDCGCNYICQCPAICLAIIRVYAAHNPFSIRAPHFVLPFIYECNLTNDYVAVRVEDFISQCFHIEVHDIEKIYAVEPVNNLEIFD